MVMGIVNVTPDSFYDGGRYLDAAAAVEHGRELLAEGADLLDVGGESSRPGAVEIGEEEEMARILPVIEALAGEGHRVSVDTVKAGVAARAVSAGATLINDVSGKLWPIAAELGVGWVAMHRRGTPATMQGLAHYRDVVREVHRSVLEMGARAAAAGVREVWLDPGIGFAKTAMHNLELLGHLGALVEAAADAGQGVLVGTSRKSFLGRIGTGDDGRDRAPLPVEDRLPGSLATTVWAVTRGVGMVRVHDVAATVRTVRLIGTAGSEAVA